MTPRKIVNDIHQCIQNLFHHNPLTILSIFIAGIFVLCVYVYPMMQPSELRVVFLDIGQGDAIWIQAPNGRELLIDSGPDHAVIERLGSEKDFFDRTIDFALATHSDADHIGGFPYIFDQFSIPVMIESEITSPTVTDRVLTEKISAERGHRLTARSGERIILDQKKHVVIDILFPDQNPNGWETNEASVVVRVSYGDTSFLLTGDSPSEVEEFLVQEYGEQLKSNVLKLGHHGSKTSSSDIFLKTVRPDITIVSAGLGNKYGHPAPDVIERVESINAQIFETSRMGSIDCRSNGITVSCHGGK
jgi:competence protein ComEC